MLKRWRKENPVLFCVGAICSLLLLNLAENLLLRLLPIERLLGPLAEVEFTFLLLQDAIGGAAVLCAMRAAGLPNPLRRQGCGFGNGMLVPMALWVQMGYGFAVTLIVMRPDTPLRPGWEILVFLLSMFSVGFTEELLFRGVVAYTLLEHFGTGRGGIWRAVGLSGLLFGAAHLVNLGSSAPLGVFVQSVVSAFFGMVMAAVFFRTGNLWVCIALHTFIDVTGLILGGLYGTESFSGTVSSYDWGNLVVCVFHLLVLYFLLRKKKLCEVELYTLPGVE